MDQSWRQRAIALLSKIAKVQVVTRWGRAKVRIGMMIKTHHPCFAAPIRQMSGTNAFPAV